MQQAAVALTCTSHHTSVFTPRLIPHAHKNSSLLTPPLLAFVYSARADDIIGVRHRGKAAEPEEIRVSCVGVYKIFEGLLAQADVVLDTMPWHVANQSQQKEVGCVVT